MTDPPPYPESVDNEGVGQGRGSTTGTPRWVKVSGIIAIVLILLIGGLMLFGGGSHGPGRHTGSGDADGRTPPASVPEDHAAPSGDVGGHTPPEGGHTPPSQ